MEKTILPLLAVLSFSAPAFAEGDADAGEKVFKKCAACHAVGDGARNKVGPKLNGIVGATMGSVDGFKYSDAFVAAQAEGRIWTAEELAAFLARPKAFMKGTKMAFAGLKKDEDLSAITAYLNSFPE